MPDSTPETTETVPVWDVLVSGQVVSKGHIAPGLAVQWAGMNGLEGYSTAERQIPKPEGYDAAFSEVSPTAPPSTEAGSPGDSADLPTTNEGEPVESELGE